MSVDIARRDPAGAGRLRPARSVHAPEALATVMTVWGLPLLFALAAQWVWVDNDNFVLGTLLWGSAIILFATGYYMLGGPHHLRSIEGPSLEGERSLARRHETLVVCGIVLVGAWLRLYRLGSVPAGLNHDAAWNGLYAIRLRQDLDFAPYVAEAWGRETLFHMIIAVWQVVVGNSKLAINLAAASVGIATFAPMYLLVRRLSGVRIALVALFLLACSGWHLTFSKVGWRAILVPLFAAAALYALTRAVQTSAAVWYSISGAVAAGALYTYDAGRGVAIVVVVLLGMEVWRNKLKSRAHLRGAAACGLSLLVVALPLMIYAMGNWSSFTGRGRALWIGARVSEAGDFSPVFSNMKSALMLYNWRGNGDDFYIDQPLLDLPVSVCLVFGAVIVLFDHKKLSSRVFLVTMAIGALIGVLAIPNGNRSILTLVPAMVFAATYIREAWRVIERSFGIWAARAVLLIAAVAIVVSTSTTYGANGRHQHGFYPEATAVGEYMGELSADYLIYAGANNWPRDALTYLSFLGEGDPMVRRYEYSTDPMGFVHLASGERPLAVILEATPEGDEAFSLLLERFPSAREDIVYTATASDRVASVVLVEPFSTSVDVPIPEPGNNVEVADGSDLSTSMADQVRRHDLLVLADHLERWFAAHGEYPSTGDRVQTACRYRELDALCVLNESGADITMTDSADASGAAGYWYQSDGSSYVLYAALEGKVLESESCVPPEMPIGGLHNLFCLSGR